MTITRAQAPNQKFYFLPLHQAGTPAQSGLYEVVVGYWWAHVPGLGLLLYRMGTRGPFTPQANIDGTLARKILTAQYGKIWPTVEVIQVPAVFLPHHCEYHR